MTTDFGAGRRAATSTTFQAREDARQRGNTVVDVMPWLPPAASPFVPPGIDPSDVVWAETIGGPGYAHMSVARGTRIRLEDIDGAACAHVMLFNALNTAERLNVADTVKIPWQAYLGKGHPLLSGDGRVLATIAQDTAQRHDTFAGPSTLHTNEVRYGAGGAASSTPAARELLKLAATKQGLDPRDIAPVVSLFKGVDVAPDGALDWTGSAGPGLHVDLIAEVPLIILIANAPHALDPNPRYECSPLRVHAWKAQASSPDDPWWSQSPERERAYLNTVQYLQARGIA